MFAAQCEKIHRSNSTQLPKEFQLETETLNNQYVSLSTTIFSESKVVQNGHSQQSQMYSVLLRKLCDQFLEEHNNELLDQTVYCSNRRTSAIINNVFDALSEDDLKYPYWSFLCKLKNLPATDQVLGGNHNIQVTNNGNKPIDSSIKSAMHNLSIPMSQCTNLADTNGMLLDNLFSTKLQNIVLVNSLQKIASTPENNTSVNNIFLQPSIGSILSSFGNYCNDVESGQLPEFFYSSVLLKICAIINEESDGKSNVNEMSEREEINFGPCGSESDYLSSSCLSSDSFDEWKPKKKRKKLKHKESLEDRKPVNRDQSHADNYAIDACDVPVSNLMKLLLESKLNTSRAKNDGIASEKNVLHSSVNLSSDNDKILNNILFKSSHELQKQYSKEISHLSASTCANDDTEFNFSHSSNICISQNNKSTRKLAEIPALIPCSLIDENNFLTQSLSVNASQQVNKYNASFSSIFKPHDQRTSPIAVNTFELDKNKKVAYTGDNLSVSNMLCQLELCADSSNSVAEVKPTDNKMCASSGLEDHSLLTDSLSCGVCHQLFPSSFELHCHQISFHNAKEKLRD